MIFRRFAFLPVFSLLAIGLAACETAQDSIESVFTEEEPINLFCPKVQVVENLTRYVGYLPGGTDLSEVLVEAEMQGLATVCRYDRGGPAVEVEVTLTMEVTKGPANRTGLAEFDYFVAILDGSDRIVDKRLFPTRFEFPRGQLAVQVVEPLRQEIPLPTLDAGEDYRILLGFQLSERQLENNIRLSGS